MPEDPVANNLSTSRAGDDILEIRSRRLIYIVDEDTSQVGELAAQMGNYGYLVQYCTDLEGLNQAVSRVIPTAILVDLAFQQKAVAGMQAICQVLGAAAPVLFMSADDGYDTRLQAVRAKGNAFLIKPLDASSLVDVLEQYAHQDMITSDPYRVLVVDDSPTQALFTTHHLNKIGVETHTLNDPAGILQELIEFNPDLIILDMYMPEADGNEIAGVIRQNEAFVSIPIVFLSTETDRDRQLEAMSLGGDDFLTKPIKPGHLTSAVISRAERYRKLRSLMMRDSLTGLYNHTSTFERLRQELLQAERRGSLLCYATLDLDHFKSVNDTYGHAAGDRVLRNLANLMGQLLRRSDTIGRLGGEEFGVILPDTSLQAAGLVMDRLRECFASLQHRSENQAFSTTFSCGVASFPKFHSPAEISLAGDQALYEAKRQGRNQVILARD